MTSLDETTLRALYPGTRHQTYLDSAAVGLISQPVLDSMREIAEEHSLLGVSAGEKWRTNIARTRDLVARLVGGGANRVAFTQNTSTAIALVINGIDWRDGDNVVLPDGEFPSNLYPWLSLRRRGVEIRRILMEDGHADEAALIEALDARTRVLAVSAVQYSSGYRYDLQRLGNECSRRETLLVVDGTQSVGALTMNADSEGIDVLCVSAHKWLLGPFGAGFAHFSPRAMERIHPSVVGWMSVVDPFSFSPEPHLADDGRRFESGTELAVNIAGLSATVSINLGIGPQAVENAVLEKTYQLEEICARFGFASSRPANSSRHSGILIVSRGGDEALVHSRLVESNVQCSLRAAGVRLSPHYFTTQSDLNAFSDALATACSK